MKTTTTYLFATALLALFLCMACSRFDDINTNPDEATRVPASMLCTNILLRITKYGGDSKAYIAANAFPKYIAYANESQLAEQYNKIGAAGFDHYSAWPNIDEMVRYARGERFEEAYTGVAYFAKAYMLYSMTMQVGDIPCTDAGLGEENFKPGYDTQESVFSTILTYLEQAEAAFAGASEEKFPGDPVYDGDAARWRKAVNAFTLKVLLSLSKKTDVASLNVKERFARIVGNGVLMTGNADNFLTRLADETGKYHPLYKGEKFTSNVLLGSLPVDALKALNDYRLFYYAEPSPVKLAAGKRESEPDAYVGVDVSTSYDNLNLLFNGKDYSRLNVRYEKEKAPEPLVVLSYAEQQLVIAEAIETGWVQGESQAYYESGVKAALAFTGDTDPAYAHEKAITQAYIDGYFTGNAAYAATSDKRLEQIRMQRYLLHFMQDPVSSYYEYRRTGYPAFPVDPATNLNENNKNGLPLRWLYPAVESTTNRSHLEEALQRQYDGYDEVNKTMWLLK